MSIENGDNSPEEKKPERDPQAIVIQRNGIQTKVYERWAQKQPLPHVSDADVQKQKEAWLRRKTRPGQAPPESPSDDSIREVIQRHALYETWRDRYGDEVGEILDINNPEKWMDKPDDVLIHEIVEGIGQDSASEEHTEEEEVKR